MGTRFRDYCTYSADDECDSVWLSCIAFRHFSRLRIKMLLLLIFMLCVGVLFSMSLLNSISWSSCRLHFFFPISASLPFLFTWYFATKVFRFECSFGWRALPLSVTKLISLLLFVFCSHLILSFAVSVSRSKHQIQVTVSSLSSVFYYYHIMSSFLYIEMLTGDVACVLSYSVFTDKHKIA